MFHRRIVSCASAPLRRVVAPTSLLRAVAPIHRLNLSTRHLSTAVQRNPFDALDTFERRHIGPTPSDQKSMLETLGFKSLDAFVAATIPKSILLDAPLDLPSGVSEREALEELKQLMSQNQLLRSYIGMGYYNCITPAPILRNMLENPGWYTPYTPYQAEISQGRLESIMNFQTMVLDMTAMDCANASLLDESTACAEAMALCHSANKNKVNAFFVDHNVHPQNIALIKTRAEAFGIELTVADFRSFDFAATPVCGALVQYPSSDGTVEDYEGFIARAHGAGSLVAVATDLLALAVLKAPGELGADIALGSAQRFGVSLGYGGPHAAFFAVRDSLKRQMPGRLIGVSRDSNGNPAYRMALQTREQHIRRDRATSNICTAQALLANMAAMYAVYHGPQGIRAIAEAVHHKTAVLATGLNRLGYGTNKLFFDTLKVDVQSAGNTVEALEQVLLEKGINVRNFGDQRHVGISLDETVEIGDVQDLLEAFAQGSSSKSLHFLPEHLLAEVKPLDFGKLARQSTYLQHSHFTSHHSETSLMRYMAKLEKKDLGLNTTMIPLGSCTMKLNAASEMIPVTWPHVANLHPFVPIEQATGYQQMMGHLEQWLATITGFPAVSLQPNSGSNGEYAGLRVIAAYLKHKGQGQRNICLIPTSAHGTNPASAVMAGFKVVVVAANKVGEVDMDDLRAKIAKHASELGALMVTYPSTHGVFEETIKEICDLVHAAGGQVYMDGANMNAQVGFTNPGLIGADVCHLNLHKTFCIPHGGGGPGMGPIGVGAHLARFLPSHPVISSNSSPEAIGPVSGAPWSSASILPISYMYIRMMGASGLRQATAIAILNANYMANRLVGHYDILYRGKHGQVAHEFIIDCRSFKELADIEVTDVAKRLLDYGFHAPTVSWPVAGTMMVEPTESENRLVLDRFCDALISIRAEINDIVEGRLDRVDNPLKNAPHTQLSVINDTWSHKYTRQQAAFPAAWLKDYKHWPSVGRLDDVYGDRNLVCTCPPLSDYETV